MLTLTDISFRYSRHRDVIRNFSLHLAPGTVCGLLGKNGSGKTTLLYMICGLLKPRTGVINFNGHIPFDRDVSFLNDIMIVPEEFDMPKVTLQEYADINSCFYPRFNRDHLERNITILDIAPDINLGQCSMGQKKKAFLAFALACNTSLLLLDEPTNGLDISSKRTFRKAVTASMTDDKIFIISTHQVHDVDAILDHVTIIDREGVLLNESIGNIAEKLRFSFTNDSARITSSLLALDAPGGANIIEYATPDNKETSVNLESLFELAESHPETVTRLGLNS